VTPHRRSRHRTKPGWGNTARSTTVTSTCIRPALRTSWHLADQLGDRFGWGAALHLMAYPSPDSGSIALHCRLQGRR
jgi:hypothetical protein